MLFPDVSCDGITKIIQISSFFIFKVGKIIKDHIVRSLNNPTFTNPLACLISSLVGSKFELALFVLKYIVFCVFVPAIHSLLTLMKGFMNPL